MALFDDEYAANPHPALAELRQAGPVHRVTSAAGIPFWMVTRWDEARQVLTDPSLSKRQPVDQLPAELRAALATQMLLRDPPDHTRLRRLVSAAFTPRRTQALRPRIEQITDRLLDELATVSEPDLIDRFAIPLPLEVICELLGIPGGERRPFHAWTNVIIGGSGGPADMVAAMSAIVAYFRDLLARKRAQPEDDLLGALLAVVDDGDRLSDDEVVGMALLLLVAGHETTANLIGNAVHLLCRQPDQRERVLKDPGLLPAVVEEVLRMASPSATSTYRVTTRPITLGATTIPAGEQVLISLLAVNRDPRRFTDPETFDPARGDGGHLAFGHGIHFCLGAPLARVEAQIALTRLFGRHPEIQLAVRPEELRWRTGLLMHGLEALPVRLRAETSP
ncbi:cytochrome P450 family protein [Actinoplanes regularis]|uniref:cytochrome P450 family protein n=1 Tax=Actinoplanes regularis TaxID=52697 RepID=UPI0024A27490|nr:cytochrome P450 [Actinoplanes regularis]GLW34683.1 cytochrome P450 hydroxylase [Actinoplanes regularis]